VSMCAPTIAGDSCLKARVGNADHLQASVHDLQTHAGNANTFPDVDTTGTCDSLHQGGGMSAGINTEVREESRNDPQSLSTSGDSEDLLNQKQQQWFPYEDSFKLNDETTLTSADVIRMLAPFLVDGRKQRIEEVVANRTYSVCPVVEGLLDLGNVSAVFRSADALGFQSVHVISNVSNRRYKKNRKVSAGAEKWLDVEMWENTGACIATLKARGYRIAVTHIAPDTVSIHDMDWRVPTAVFFGNEHKGVSAEAIALSDIRCSIPMAGMVDSFNVSVAAGILMHHAVHDRIARAVSPPFLSEFDTQMSVWGDYPFVV
jgi:tRNA G18 (ribose-2'-O)-methylase SpoU